VVNEVFEEMLNRTEATLETVSMAQLADELGRRGLRNPRTKRPPTRQSLWDILNRPANVKGQLLLERSRKRQTMDARLVESNT
jgi:hypothetical protein